MQTGCGQNQHYANWRLQAAMNKSPVIAQDHGEKNPISLIRFVGVPGRPYAGQYWQFVTLGMVLFSDELWFAYYVAGAGM